MKDVNIFVAEPRNTKAMHACSFYTGKGYEGEEKGCAGVSVPSSTNFLPSFQPNEEAAANFIRMLDLAPQGNEEVLPPDFTPNPLLERVDIQN
ncbi:hypothetical protein RIF29_13870 [Crotalaria pallida]|uniref:Uncharacterized protein n=1 Tax=Crotalaria pallida TaxID=3830 RepID=A0AAN9ID98_CROPI